MIVDVQLSPAVEPFPRLLDGVRHAEALGFGTAWVFDHLAGSMLGGDTMIECFTLLGALAASTERIGLGSLVVNVANRNPGLMAAAAASVQHISGGRFTLGLGAGAAPGSRWSAEHDRLGIELGATMSRRHARLTAVLDELDRLWHDEGPGGRDGADSGDGGHGTARHARRLGFPVPRPRPPVVIGVNSPELAIVAARRAAGVNIRGDHPRLEDIVAAATAARGRVHHPPGPWSVSVYAIWDEALLDDDHPLRRRWQAFGVDRLVLVWLTPHERADLERAAAAFGLGDRPAGPDHRPGG